MLMLVKAASGLAIIRSTVTFTASARLCIRREEYLPLSYSTQTLGCPAT